MVPIEHAELGTELEVERPDETVDAVVVKKPFVDPEEGDSEAGAERVPPRGQDSSNER